jgi:hypothetical protein
MALPNRSIPQGKGLTGAAPAANALPPFGRRGGGGTSVRDAALMRAEGARQIIDPSGKTHPALVVSTAA